MCLSDLLAQNKLVLVPLSAQESAFCSGQACVLSFSQYSNHLHLSHQMTHKVDAQRTGIVPLLEAVSRSLFGKRRSFVQRPPLPRVGMKGSSFVHFSYI